MCLCTYKDTILFNQRVIVSNGTILGIEPAGKKPELKIDHSIHAAGKYLIPGFTDMHFHQETSIENESKLLLANGITCVSNMAERTGQDQIAIKNKANRNTTLAPYYYTAGPYLTQGHLGNEADAVQMVQLHKKRGYDFIKLAGNLEQKVYLKLLEEAQKHSIPVVGHGQRAMPLEYTLKMKMLAHLEELIYILTDSQQKDTVFLKQVAKTCKGSGIYVTPTLGVFEMIRHYTDNTKFESLKKENKLKYVPEEVKRYWMSENSYYRSHAGLMSPAGHAWQQEKLNWQLKFAKMLQQAGVPLLTGSDATGLNVNGFALHHEFELMKAAEFSNYEILKSTTLTAAQFLNREAVAGSVEEGKLADLVLLDKNPLKEITNTASIRGVMIKGKWLDRKKLDALLKEVETSVGSSYPPPPK